MDSHRVSASGMIDSHRVSAGGMSEASGVTKRSVVTKDSARSTSGLTVAEKGGVEKFLMNWDQFNFYQEDLYNSTPAGGYLSLVVYFIVVTLIGMEIWSFVSVDRDNIVTLDGNDDSLLQINFDMIFHDIPCDSLRLSVLDAFGWEKIDTTDSSFIQYHSIDHKGQSKGQFYTQDEINILEAQDKQEDLPEWKLKELESDWASSDDLFKHRSFKDAVTLHEFSFVLFYADWCSHCRDFHPTWNKLKETVAKGKKFVGNKGDEEEVKILKINCVDFAQVCQQQQIRAFPTLLFFSKSMMQRRQKPINYNLQRDLTTLLEFIAGNVKKLDHVRAHHHYMFASGCQAIGHLEVPRVPGEFRFELDSLRSKADLNPAFVNVSHTVNHLSFGDASGAHANKGLITALAKMKESGREDSTNKEGDAVRTLVMYPFEARVPKEILRNLNPVDARSFYTTKFHEAPNHHLKVVATFMDEGRLLAYQITHSSSNIKVSNESKWTDWDYELNRYSHSEGRPNLPQARFLYDLSPMSVRIEPIEHRWYDFITNVLGIIGGFYTIAKVSGRVILSISS